MTCLNMAEKYNLEEGHGRPPTWRNMGGFLPRKGRGGRSGRWSPSAAIGFGTSPLSSFTGGSLVKASQKQTGLAPHISSFKVAFTGYPHVNVSQNCFRAFGSFLQGDPV